MRSMAVPKIKKPSARHEAKVVALREPEDPYTHLDDADELDDVERERLHKGLRAALDEIKAGKGIPGEEIIKELETL